MNKILVNNNLDTKIASYFYEKEGFRLIGDSLQDEIDNEYPVVIGNVDDKYGFYSTVENHPEAKSVKDYLKDYKINVTDVSENLVIHVKEVAKHFELTLNKKSDVIVLNRNSEKEISFNVNEFLDIFDDNLVFKKSIFTFESHDEYMYLVSCGENILKFEYEYGKYTFDKTDWKWKGKKSKKSYLNPDFSLLYVRNLNLISIDDSYRLIRSLDFISKIVKNPSFSFYTPSKYKFLRLDETEFTTEGNQREGKIINTIGFTELNKIARTFYFEFLNEVYKTQTESLDIELLTGTSCSGETIVVKNHEVQIVNNSRTDTSFDYYVLQKTHLINNDELILNEKYFEYKGKSYYYGNTQLIPAYDETYYDTDNKVYLELLNPDLVYCFNDFNTVKMETVNLINGREYIGKIIDLDGEVYYKYGSTNYCTPKLGDISKPPIWVPLFEDIPKLYTDELKYDLERYTNYLENGIYGESPKDIVHRVVRTFNDIPLEYDIQTERLLRKDIYNNSISKYLATLESTCELTGRHLKISVNVFGKTIRKEFDVVPYELGYSKLIQKL